MSWKANAFLSLLAARHTTTSFSPGLRMTCLRIFRIEYDKP